MQGADSDAKAEAQCARLNAAWRELGPTVEVLREQKSERDAIIAKLVAALQRNLPAIRMTANLDDTEAAEAALRCLGVHQVREETVLNIPADSQLRDKLNERMFDDFDDLRLDLRLRLSSHALPACIAWADANPTKSGRTIQERAAELALACADEVLEKAGFNARRIVTHRRERDSTIAALRAVEELGQRMGAIPREAKA